MRTPARAYLLLGTGMAIFGSGTPVSKVVTGAFPVFLASGLRMALAAAVLAPLLAWRWRVDAAGFDPSTPGTTDWLALAWWGVGTMALGSVLWYSGVQQVPGTTAAAFMGVMPVSALLLSYLLLGEAFAPVHAIGMLAVLAAIAAVTRSHAHSG